MARQINVALIGNPNVGKTSVFNRLTGLNQKVGNYPGITVEKKEGTCRIDRNLKAHVLDLPGTYSLNASSIDENVVIELLLNRNDKDFPDVAVVVAEAQAQPAALHPDQGPGHSGNTGHQHGRPYGTKGH